jgi:predicted RNA-binding protein YlqC (UPF0109 family)
MSNFEDANGGEVEYEEGDINTVSAASSIDDDFDNDLDSDFDGADDEADTGNRAHDAMSVSVLTYIAKALASEPESVVVHSESQRNGIRLRLHVAPEDMGRVIGRRGRTAQAIRTVVGVAGARDGVAASVDIDDD